MKDDLPAMDFQRFWRRLQRIGLNAYEARTYLVLVGHTRFRAVELAARASVPRQKIYEVLHSLVEKGLAQVVQEKTKLFSAVDPGIALGHYILRRHATLDQELAEQGRLASGLVEDLNAAYAEAQGGVGALDYLQIVAEPGQTARQYRRMLSAVQAEYLEFSRPPYAVDPLEEQLVKQARLRGVDCRLLLESPSLDDAHRQRLEEYVIAGVQVRQAQSLPLKLALFDGRHGLIALLDPVVTRPAWTAVVFDHPGLGEAMKGLFEDHWRRAEAL